MSHAHREFANILQNCSFNPQRICRTSRRPFPTNAFLWTELITVLSEAASFLKFEFQKQYQPVVESALIILQNRPKFFLRGINLFQHLIRQTVEKTMMSERICLAFVAILEGAASLYKAVCTVAYVSPNMFRRAYFTF